MNTSGTNSIGLLCEPNGENNLNLTRTNVLFAYHSHTNTQRDRDRHREIYYSIQYTHPNNKYGLRLKYGGRANYTNKTCSQENKIKRSVENNNNNKNEKVRNGEMNEVKGQKRNER